MFKALALASALMISTVVFAATSVVEGPIAKVVKAKTEIYVTSKDDGKKREYYFNKETQVMNADGQPATFDDLKEGMNVRVTATKKGKRLDPTKVEILKEVAAKQE